MRDWPGDPRDDRSIYEFDGLGHFTTLRECKVTAKRFLARVDIG